MSDSNNKDLINYDRTWRTVICINPGHETVQFDSNQIGEIRCPLCESLMVKVVKSILREIRNELD